VSAQAGIPVERGEVAAIDAVAHYVDAPTGVASPAEGLPPEDGGQYAGQPAFDPAAVNSGLLALGTVLANG